MPVGLSAGGGSSAAAWAVHGVTLGITSLMTVSASPT